MIDKVKVAAVQFDPKLMQNDANLQRMKNDVKMAASHGARLVVFPECALSGYLYNSREEALPYTEELPGAATSEFTSACKEANVYVIFGLLERDGERMYNAAALIGPEGLVGKYRKVHLPFLGIDRFVDTGNLSFPVFNTPIGNIGMHICYDCNFPESSRSMVLQGADILVLPTNWPQGRGKVSQHVVIVRAYENKVNLIACDRVGVERGAKFLGMSKIIDVWGDVLDEGGREEEKILYGEFSIEAAREKQIIFKKGEFELNFIADRHPEYYQELLKPVKNKE